jgi:CubicO group peptidase (beta-lactamase class C family)
MKLRSTFSCLAAFVILLAGARADEITANAGRYMKAMTDLRHFTGVVVIAREGKPLFAHGYGLADYQFQTPNTTKTKFRIGSMTKQFTAAAIMLLRESGKLSIDDPICKYVDGCPDLWKPITLRHLLSHTSGIPSYTSFPQLAGWSKRGAMPDEMIAAMKAKPLDFAPGEKMAYSNSGYVLLGRVIEKVSGHTYADFVRDSIFLPLGMFDTACERHRPLPPENSASGYTWTGQKLQRAEYLDMSVPYSAGALYSTADDLMRWDAALYTDKLLSRKALDEMFTPGKGDAGFGWFIVKDKHGRTSIEHDGAINGFASFIGRYPETKTLVLILSNLQNTNVDTIHDNLTAIAFGEPYDLPKVHTVAKVPAEVLQRYAGEYRLPWGSIMLVSTSGEHIFVGGNGPPKVELKPESDTLFYLEEGDREIRFIRDTAGKVTSLMFGELEAPRVK